MNDETRDEQERQEPDDAQSTRKLSPDEMAEMTAPDRQGPSLTADIAEKYEVIEEIARGGMGVVYKAKQKTPSRLIALKVMLQGALATEDEKRRFLHEANAAARLKHPGIVPIYEVGESEGSYYFTMEYVEGQTLAKYLETHELTLKAKLDLFQRICEIVTHAHIQGVIHRDLKPSNIMIDKDGSPRILDFGLAKMTEMGPDEHRSFVTMSGVVVGTLAYMSPEQTLGKPEEIDTRSDVYSLGVILYQMLTGAMPYPVDIPDPIETIRNIREREPKRPSTVMRILRDDLETIILKAIAKEKERRYQSAADLARDVDHYLRSEPIDARPPSAWYKFRKAVQRNKVASAATVVIILAFLVAFFWVNAARKRAEREGYYAKILAAQAKIEEHHYIQARELLESCPMRLRSWEWGRLRYLCSSDFVKAKPFFLALSAVAATPDGRGVATGRGDNAMKAWDGQTGRELLTLKGHSGSVLAVGISPDARCITTASEDKTAKVWNVKTGQELLALKGHSDSVRAVAVSPDGKRIVTGSKDNTAKVWDGETGQKLLTLKGHYGRVSAVAISPDGRRTATGSYDRTAKVWDTATGQKVFTLKGHGRSVYCLAFSPDGRRIVTGSEDEAAKVWDVAMGKEVLTLKGHTKGVRCLAFSPDGKRIVTGSLDHAAKVWEAATGRELVTMRLEDEAGDARFSPDGLNLAVAHGNEVTVFPALDWTKTPEELEQEKLERWRKMWQEAQEKKK
ncbi:MAG: serine/threonine-protein kinase [Planctomycetota bacterium]